MRTSPSLVLLAGLAFVIAAPAPAVGHAAKLEGRKLFADKGCIGCHSVGKPSPGLGPELTQVAYERDAAWLRAWLADPRKIKAGALMPKTAWKSQAEMSAVIEYLLDSRRPIPAADSTDGAKLFADYGCGACHAVARKGGKREYPDLGNEGRIRDRTWIEHWLENPSAVKKNAFMARFPLTPTQRKALAGWLVSLKTKK